MDEMLLEDIHRRQQLSEAYASYSQTRGGLGKVLGGVVGLVVILAGTLLGGGVVTAGLTIGATLVWLLGKELIRARFYRPLGEVKEVWPDEKRREHLLFTGFVALISAGVAAFIIFNVGINNPGNWIYLAFVVLMPVLTWRYLRTPLEFIVGVFLLSACAVHGAGGAYSLAPEDFSLEAMSKVAPAWPAFIGAVVLIGVGLREHRYFQELTSRLKAEG
ncbi:MAG: hypothetical protein DIU68_016270 [Chloroflexota bacterium]|nr:MAG: hypothetical protein DIU68_09780 [Chloroflexota bacterium]